MVIVHLANEVGIALHRKVGRRVELVIAMVRLRVISVVGLLKRYGKYALMSEGQTYHCFSNLDAIHRSLDLRQFQVARGPALVESELRVQSIATPLISC
jgi:hypothetical protein